MKTALLILTMAGLVPAAETPKSFDVKVTGKGQPMILIPGLASSGDVWNSTVERFRDRYECHVVNLAGFAGLPPVSAPSLEIVRNEIAQYIQDKKLVRPIMVGTALEDFCPCGWRSNIRILSDR